ncbi:MAG TPA: bifunctional helix-turn-helix transcriptional regulator/GNAT family N-acetyltransferase [Actinocrinis sp.]|uniref:bifunctional helix-turn-helix transcriptional regulator/GNAT family N-acetyltransferase n=1 Tax=Actinocrinis sp. TaxID=1920516 RepID=UPI002DDD7B92|nr:bifunctional helix-turn-helix transcriptional regulator/GNAT family N-acetyltransferase [Actinocrinis sp.]HEV2347516.1 bifunctional helix-turn-helix transcriptional regulator/GNAT family N-acetyltransferase [Actinocrinis sp.]
MTNAESDADPVAAVRAFTRFYTAQLSVLREGLLGTPYSMAEARIVFELNQYGSADSADLRRALDLDAGYLSRILARFEADGLVTRRPSTIDARRQTVTLTETGRGAFTLLDQRSNNQVRELLKSLTPEQTQRLTDAMNTIRELLGGEPRRAAYILRPARPGDYGWVVSRHGALYAEELGWNHAIEAYCARVVADYVEKHDPRRENAWIAEADGAPVGSIFCVRRDEDTAQLRLLLVEPSTRGLGIGGRLVEECVRFARQARYRRIVLFTTEMQRDAARIYRKAGFALVEETEGDTFAPALGEQLWSMGL